MGGKDLITSPTTYTLFGSSYSQWTLKCIDSSCVNSFNQNVFMHILHIVHIDCISTNCPSIVANRGNDFFFQLLCALLFSVRTWCYFMRMIQSHFYRQFLQPLLVSHHLHGCQKGKWKIVTSGMQVSWLKNRKFTQKRE